MDKDNTTLSAHPATIPPTVLGSKARRNPAKTNLSAQTRDPKRSQAAILTAANREFVAHGFSGASVNEIASGAGINKRMLYHYFGNKEGLFLAVLEAAYERIRSGERALDLDHMAPDAALEKLVLFSYDHFIEHPDFLALLNIENLHEAEHLKKSDRVQRIHSPFVEALRDLLKRGEKAGIMRSGVDPVELYITIASLSFFHLSNRHTLSFIFDRPIADAGAVAARRQHVLAVITGFLRP